MKKFIALVLAIVMMAAISIPVFAASAIPENPQDHYPASKPLTPGENGTSSGNVEVHYEVKSAYEVVIPENVVFVDNNGFKFTADVEARNVIIGKQQQLGVYIKSANGFRMMPQTGEGNADGVLYVVGYVKNTKQTDFDWPTDDNGIMTSELQSKLGSSYKEAAATTDPEDLGDELILVQGGSKQTVGTTMMFFLPQQETTLGHYMDTLTFTAKLYGDVIS